MVIIAVTIDQLALFIQYGERKDFVSGEKRKDRRRGRTKYFGHLFTRSKVSKHCDSGIQVKASRTAGLPR